MKGKGKKKPRVSNTEIHHSQTNNANNAPKHPSSPDSDAFYNKLIDFWDTLGLTLIINARESLLDLYLLYSEVTTRGGNLKVSRDRKWDEVACALKLEGSSNGKLPSQLEKCYTYLLYPFEQLYHYRDPAQKAASNNILGVGVVTDVSSGKKRKSEATFSELIDNKDGKVVTKICKEMTGAELTEHQVLLLTPTKAKEAKKRRVASLRRYKTAYQIFLKQECARLKTRNEALVGSNMLHMAIDTWKKMSESEKQPYVEESKKEKERLKEEMKKTENRKEEEDVEGGDTDYHVTLKPDADNFPVGMSQCDAYCSLDIPTEASK
ncbi:high mobility group B protein 10-like [Senna tora]|uniref:High mobility group B protein 10-like n=1 Tax=Senna tora TaxID=362788 RepID=A0A834SKG2_9FABA|nr:high mobility group B protein 10-like [Senna tora]